MSKEINFHPDANNVFDYVGRSLVTVSTGEKVFIAQKMTGRFMVYVAGILIEDGLSNTTACSVLNKIRCRLAE